jgi:DNA-binding SARP family transcriptional activator
VILLRRELAGPEGELRANAGDEETRLWAIDDVLDAALTTTGADVAEIFLRDDGASSVSLAGFRGPYPEAFKQITRFEEGEGYPGLVVREGRPLGTLDASSDERFLRKRVKDLGFCCFLCVPVPGPERPVGSLDVAWRRGSEALFSHCLTLSRDAERLALLLERRDGGYSAGHAAHVADEILSSDEGRLDLSVLGRFEARRGRTRLSIDSFARRRAVTLLKILLTNYGRVVLRDELIELLWPSDPPKDAAKLLQVAAHYLRRGLGEGENGKTEGSFISTQPNGYAFNPASFHRVDALEFEAMAQRGLDFERRGRWREALVALRAAAEMYSGDYLEDEPYSDWCVRRRRQLRERLFDVLLASARLLRSDGDFDATIRCYRRMLELDPCLEEVHRDLMDVLSRCGRRTQALRQYEACRQVLKEEFGVAPVMETETLYRSILGRLTV